MRWQLQTPVQEEEAAAVYPCHFIDQDTIPVLHQGAAFIDKVILFREVMLNTDVFQLLRLQVVS